MLRSVGVTLAFLCLLCFVECNNITLYGNTVSSIFNAALGDTTGYNRLEELCNTYGPRLSGTAGLENAIDWIVSEMQKDGFDSVTTEDVTVTTWVRNSASLQMTYPRSKQLDLLALGGSIATPVGGITATVVVVTSFDDLATKAANGEVAGNIVVYNVPWQGSYGGTVSYRTRGAIEASRYGAVASLTRSITPFSLYTPHTGVMYYDAQYPAIPSAAITPEDANLLAYFYKNNQAPVLTLTLSCQTLAPSTSRNVIADYYGSVLPHELVVIGGHVDSWDVGSGAHDDAGGCLQTWEAVRVLASLGLRPRRTIRVVLWTNEENGGAGADTYFANHVSQLPNTTFCFESDGGTFTPISFSFSGNSAAQAEVQQIADLMNPSVKINVVPGGAGADVAPLTAAGVPGVGLIVADDGVGVDTYFWYHHTRADTPDHVDLDEFQLCVGTVASLAYVVADMADNLPK